MHRRATAGSKGRGVRAGAIATPLVRVGPTRLVRIASIAPPVAHPVDVVGEFEQADGLAVADQDALHAQAALAAGGLDAGGERRGGAEFAIGRDQQVRELPAGFVEAGERTLERGADVSAAAEALAEEAGEPADAIDIDAYYTGSANMSVTVTAPGTPAESTEN